MILPIVTAINVPPNTTKKFKWVVLPDNTYPSFCQVFSDHLGDFLLYEYFIVPHINCHLIHVYEHKMTKDGWVNTGRSRELAETTKARYEEFWKAKVDNYE